MKWNQWGSAKMKNCFNLAFILCLPVIISITSSAKVHAAGNGSSVISRNHVAVWFDYTVRFYDHEADNAYSKEDLSVMVDLVSTRFGKIVLERAPLLTSNELNKSASPHSRTLVPIVAAEHNLKYPDKKLEVVVTFDSAFSSGSSLTVQYTSSFKVAYEMAQKANEVHPGTVTTLMMDQRFSPRLYYGSLGATDQLMTARAKINSTDAKFGYALAVLLDIRDCGHFKGPLGQKAKESLPHVDMFVFFIRPNFHHASFDTDVLHKIFVNKFEDCERKLRQEKPDVKVMPAVVVMLGSLDTMKLKSSYDEKVMVGWQMMSKWAEKNDREVLMFEAFDTPLGSIVTNQGWWKLKDKGDHEIRKDSFVEKIQEVQLNMTNKADSGSTSSNEDFSEEDTDSWTPRPRKERKLRQGFTSTSSSTEAIPEAVYIVLILLTVVCTLLVAVIAGLVYGFHVIMLRQSSNQRIFQGQPRPLPTTSTSNGYHRVVPSLDEDDRSVLEISDTSPIVTYKKDQNS